MPSSYVIALGSNRRGRHGAPADEVRAALAALTTIGGDVVMTSPLITTSPLGPARRRFVNAAALVESEDSPPELLVRLKAIEAAFGRRRGQRWTDRVIDLDIILWSGGAWASDGLTVPHPEFRRRDFVLRPLVTIAPDWRDPVTGLSVRQLTARRRRD
jgi:2-amino-4-hydroxy-6-hydroxymethyldihydropteridine diphosphokinase